MNLEFYPFKILESDQGKFLYIVHSGGLFEIDEDLNYLLNCEGKSINEAFDLAKNRMTEERFVELLKDMKNAQLLKNQKESIPDVCLKENKSLCSVTLMLAQECNLRCVYCYGEGGEYGKRGVMSIEVAEKAIDYLVENSEDEKLYVVFFGGEPLLKFDIIKAVVKYCKEIEARTIRKFYYSITTNGTLIDQEIEKFFIENKFAVQISIDGIKEKHDANRYFANKVGCYDKVLENTKVLREKFALSARATASRNNLDYIEIFEHLYSLGFVRITIAAAQNVLDEVGFEELLREYKKYIWYFYKLVKQGKYDKACKMNDILMPLRKIEFGSERYLSCGVVRTMCAVDISGQIYPCHRFVSCKSCVIGDVYGGTTEKSSFFLDKTLVQNHKQCSNCWAKNLCLGGCPNENFEFSGDVTISSVRTCRFNRMLYEELLKVYIGLTEDEKNKIFSVNPNL